MNRLAYLPRPAELMALSLNRPMLMAAAEAGLLAVARVSPSPMAAALQKHATFDSYIPGACD